MSANHSDCRYAIRGDRVPVTGSRYTTYFLCGKYFVEILCMSKYFVDATYDCGRVGRVVFY